MYVVFLPSTVDPSPSWRLKKEFSAALPRPTCVRGARRARASLVSDVEKRRQTVSDYTAGRYLVMSRKAEEIGGHD